MRITQKQKLVVLVVLGSITQAFAQDPIQKPKTIEPRIDKGKQAQPVPQQSKPASVTTPAQSASLGEIPDVLKPYVQRADLFGEDGKSSSCVFVFEGRCFTSLKALRKTLLEDLRAVRRDRNLKWTEEEAYVLDEKQEKAAKKVLYRLDGQLLSERGLDRYLVEAYYAEVRKASAPKPALTEPPPAPAPEPLPSGPKATTEDGYSDFSKQEKRTVGLIRTRRPMFLSEFVYARAGKYGPVGRMELPDTNRLEVENFSAQSYQPVELCLFVEELRKSLPAEKQRVLIERKDLASLRPYLLADREGRIDLNSLRVEEGQNAARLCYRMEHGIYYVRRDDVARAVGHYNKVFEGFQGLSAVSTAHRAELQALWDSGKNDLDRVVAVEKFWRTKVAYLLDDHALYQNYFAKNPEGNLLSAACALGQGRCVPKNFGLAVTIYQLSKGKIAVRLDSGYAVDRSEHEERQIRTDSLHLGVQALIVNEKTGNGTWRNFEASIGTESNKEIEQAAATNAEIFKLIRDKLGAKKALRIPMKFTQLASSDLHVSVNNDLPDEEFVTAVTVEKMAAPSSVERVLYFRENEKGELEYGQESSLADLVTPQVIPKTTLSEVLGAEKYLASFMGNASYANDKSFGRSWEKIGANRYRDTRVLKLYLPDGSTLEEMHVYEINFDSPHLLERITTYENGVKTGVAVVESRP